MGRLMGSQSPVVIGMDAQEGTKKQQWGTDEDPLAVEEPVIEETEDNVW